MPSSLSTTLLFMESSDPIMSSNMKFFISSFPSSFHFPSLFLLFQFFVADRHRTLPNLFVIYLSCRMLFSLSFFLFRTRKYVRWFSDNVSFIVHARPSLSPLLHPSCQKKKKKKKKKEKKKKKKKRGKRQKVHQSKGEKLKKKKEKNRETRERSWKEKR